MLDVAPTLNDTQVLEFCKQGYLMLEAVVPDSINRRVSGIYRRSPLRRGRRAARSKMTVCCGRPWFVGRCAAQPAGGRRGALAAGEEPDNAHLDVQPSGQVTAFGAGMAPRRLLALRPRAESPAGVLLSAGHPAGAGTHRGAARFPLPVQPGQVHGPLSQHQMGGCTRPRRRGRSSSPCTRSGTGGRRPPRRASGTCSSTCTGAWRRPSATGSSSPISTSTT